MHKVYRKICLIIPKTPILISDLLINVIFVVFSHDDSHKVKNLSKKGSARLFVIRSIVPKYSPGDYRSIGNIPADL